MTYADELVQAFGENIITLIDLMLFQVFWNCIGMVVLFFISLYFIIICYYVAKKGEEMELLSVSPSFSVCVRTDSRYLVRIRGNPLKIE